jgi:uncharacterized membrane protein
MISVRKYLLAGILVWIPLGITIWVLKLFVDILDQSLLLLPAQWRTESWLGMHVPGQGVILVFLIVFITGVIAANFFGKQLIAYGDSVLNRIPIVRSIYGGVKQISDTLFSSDGKAFRRVVLVRYPHSGTWTVALVTGSPRNEVTDHLGFDQVSVFVPTTPNITAGFFLIVPRGDTIELEMSVDEALKYIISMGVAEPPRRRARPESHRSGNDPDPQPSPKT